MARVYQMVKEETEPGKFKWVRATKAPKGATWFIDFVDAAGRRKVQATDAVTKTEAGLILAAKKGDNVKAEILGITNPEALDTTMKEFLEETYLPYVRDNNRPGTIENYERYAKLLIERFGKEKLREIGGEQVDDFYSYLRKNGMTDWDTKMSMATVNRIMAFLRSTFYKAMERRVTDRNPCARMDLKDEENERRTILKRQDEPRLMEHAAEWLKPVLQTAILSGLRLGELTGLQWAGRSTDFKAHKVDLEEGVIEIGHGSKSGKRRRVPISPDLHKILVKLKPAEDAENPSPYVFSNPSKEGPLKKRNVQAAFEKARKAAKIWDLHFHDLRRTFASRKYEDNVSLGTIAELLGHGSTYVTERYTWLSEEHLRKAMGQPAKVARFPQDEKTAQKVTG